MKFLTYAEVKPFFAGKSVAVVGSGPGVLENAPGFVDSHDVVVRVNNYKTGPQAGFRTDVHYSFFGGSIRVTADQLRGAKVKLCMCKCPNSQPIESQWHRDNQAMNGVDFTYIYRARQGWWPSDTFVPDEEHFLRSFELLGRHIPTTGFAAILDVIGCEPASLYLTGFDFFSSGLHNVDEKWRPGNTADPIGHVPQLEAQKLLGMVLHPPICGISHLPIHYDRVVGEVLEKFAGDLKSAAAAERSPPVGNTGDGLEFGDPSPSGNDTFGHVA